MGKKSGEKGKELAIQNIQTDIPEQSLLLQDDEENAGSSAEPDGTKTEDSGKVCPKCGTLLVGKNNYCIGCGMNVDPIFAGGKPADGGTTYDGFHRKGAGYGGGNAYVAREEALKRRRKKKHDILEEGGLARFLLVFFGIFVGVLIGYSVLKAYFAPKNSDLVLYREAKVTKLAKLKTIKAGTVIKNTFVVKDVNKQEDGKTDQNKAANSSGQNPTAEAIAKNQANQFFYGKAVIRALGDKVTYMEETEEWDTSGLDPNDVMYVINNLNFIYEPYQNQIFIDYEILQEGNLVRMQFVYRNLDLTENARTMILLGIADEEALAGRRGKEYLSFRRIQALMDHDGWRMDDPRVPTVTSAPQKIER